MDEKTESLIERAASLLIGLILLLVGLLANVSDKAQTTLLAIAIPLIALATGIQLLNSVPHAIVDARNYVKNAGQQETLIPKEQVDNTTELPEWLKENIEKRAEELEDHQADSEFDELEPEPAPEPSLEDVRFPGQEPVVEENDKKSF